MYKKKAKYALLLVIAGTLFFASLVPGLEFSYDFESFFPEDDPDMAFYLDFREKFEYDDDFLLLGISNEEGIFQPDFISKLDSFSDSLANIPYMKRVVGPTEMKDFIMTTVGPIVAPVIRGKDRQGLVEDSIRIYNTPFLVNSFFSEKGKAVSLIARHESKLEKQQWDSIYSTIEGLLNSFAFDETHLSGKIKAQNIYIEKMKWETITFITASFILVVIFLAFSFRSIWGVAVPITVVLLAIIWILGLMSLTGQKINIMTTLLPTIMFVVGMSDVVHILSKYFDELRWGKNKIKAIQLTVKEVGLATFLTSITTAIGFLTLLSAAIAPVRHFGIFTAIGVVVAFILAFSSLPPILVLSKKPKVERGIYKNVFWSSFLHKSLLHVFRNYKAIAVVGVTLTAVVIYSCTFIIKDNKLLNDIADDDPLKKDFLYFENNFGGVRPFEMAILTKDSSEILEPKVVKEIAKVTDFLEENYGVNTIISPITPIKILNQSLKGKEEKYYKIPENDQTLQLVNSFSSQFTEAKEFKNLMSEDKQSGRITGRVVDHGSNYFSSKNDSLERFLKTEIDTSVVTFRLTGTSLLIDKNNEYLVQNMFQGLSIGFALIALIVGLMFRSLKMVFISLVPNILPLLMVGAVMAYTGIPLNISTSIIFTIAFGIAVDDTIHLLSKFRIELSKGRTLLYAIKRAYIGTGKALIITSMILISGFISLLLSGFASTFYTGFLISCTLVFAVVADLTLLPVLLILFYRRNKKGVKNI